MIDDAELKRATDYRRENATRLARLKADVGRTEQVAKTTESLCYKASDAPTVEERKHDARTNQKTVDAWEAHFTAVQLYETERLRFELARDMQDIWRTTKADERAFAR